MTEINPPDQHRPVEVTNTYYRTFSTSASDGSDTIGLAFFNLSTSCVNLFRRWKSDTHNPETDIVTTSNHGTYILEIGK